MYSIHSFALFPLFAGYIGLLLLGCCVYRMRAVHLLAMREPGDRRYRDASCCCCFCGFSTGTKPHSSPAPLDVLRMFRSSINSYGFAKGVVDLYSVTYFMFFITFFLFLTHALDGGTQVDRQEVNAAPRRRGLVGSTGSSSSTPRWRWRRCSIVANLIITDHNVRWDLTPNKRYSLSDFDKRVLDGLKHPVKVMAFVRTEDASYLELADLLFQVAAYTPLVTYQVIDVNKAPGLARQYGVSTYGEVIVESEGRRRDFDNSRSELLIPALLQISHASNKHIYFTVGHGERDLFDTDRTLGYSQWRGLLEQNNYQIDNVSLFAGGVPDDATVRRLARTAQGFPARRAGLAGEISRQGRPLHRVHRSLRLAEPGQISPDLLT